MSVKIYCAYRCKVEDFWAVLETIKLRARDHLSKAIDAALPQIVPESEDFPNKRVRLREAYRRYVAQLSSPERNPSDLSVSVAFRKHENYVLAIPYADMLMRRSLDFLEDIPELEDYAYWNNTDQPDHISDEDWASRGRAWDLSQGSPVVVLELISRDCTEFFFPHPF